MIGNSRRATVRVAKLHVRAALSDACESEIHEECYNFARFEDRKSGHVLVHRDKLSADEFTFHEWFAIFEEHFEHFAKIAIELVQRCTLRMGARHAGDMSNVQPCIGVALNDCGKGPWHR